MSRAEASCWSPVNGEGDLLPVYQNAGSSSAATHLQGPSRAASFRRPRADWPRASRAVWFSGESGRGCEVFRDRRRKAQTFRSSSDLSASVMAMSDALAARQVAGRGRGRSAAGRCHCPCLSVATATGPARTRPARPPRRRGRGKDDRADDSPVLRRGERRRGLLPVCRRGDCARCRRSGRLRRAFRGGEDGPEEVDDLPFAPLRARRGIIPSSPTGPAADPVRPAERFSPDGRSGTRGSRKARGDRHRSARGRRRMISAASHSSRRGRSGPRGGAGRGPTASSG